jgi:peptidoglycan/xylan/chitin deacetylase (PgdA/CDA1 family)
MRLDRAVTLLAFRAIGSLASSRVTARLPVLMYHSISAAGEDATPYYRIATHPAVFAEHMQVLEREGYTGVTLSEGLNAIRLPNLQRSTRQPVALTFDDGYRDFFTAAVPVLERHGFRATMYLPTGFIGEQRRRFKSRECLTWSEVSALHAAGFEFGSHTVTHPRLVDMTWDEIRTELIASKRTLEQQLGAEVTAFSYPYAFPQQKRKFAEQFVGLLRSSGYSTAVTTIIGHVGVQDDALCLKRLPVNSCDDSELLRAKLHGFYNWMAGPQSAAKQLKRR